MSALEVSTSMIFPFPSSPHCAPIRIVLAIEIRKWAKNFPDASGRTQSGPQTNNMLALAGCKGFCTVPRRKHKIAQTRVSERRDLLHRHKVTGVNCLNACSDVTFQRASALSDASAF